MDKPGSTKHFHDWASENGFILNDGEDLHLAVPAYEEEYEVAEEDLEDFWEEPMYG